MKLGAVGDVVNVAARVQSLSHRCGYNVLITSATYDRIKGTVMAVPCGRFSVKGREQTIEVWGIGKARADAIKELTSVKHPVSEQDSDLLLIDVDGAAKLSRMESTASIEK
jgi:hypothetical protein